MRINKYQQSQRGQSLTSYLFAVFYNWLYHTEVLMTATESTARTFISCMPLFKRCLSTWQRLLCRWCWRTGQDKCLQCSYFSLKDIDLEKKSTSSVYYVLWHTQLNASNLVKTLSKTTCKFNLYLLWSNKKKVKPSCVMFLYGLDLAAIHNVKWNFLNYQNVWHIIHVNFQNLQNINSLWIVVVHS